MRNKVLLTLILVLASPIMSFSADNSLKKGSWALQFEVDRYFDLSAFEGYTITIKKHISDGTAYRLGVSSRLEYGNQDVTNSVGDSSISSSGNDRRVVELSVDLLRLKYTNTKKIVNFFWGVGPRIDYTYSKIDYPYSGDVVSRQEKRNGWAAGLSGALGVEWFAIPSISFLAEYSSSIIYQYRKTTTTSVYRTAPLQQSEYVQKTLTEAYSAVRFGVSAYF